jgi:hypothetical protein
MVNTRSENPDIITPDFSTRVTPPRLIPPATTTADLSINSSQFVSANNSVSSEDMSADGPNHAKPPGSSSGIPFPSIPSPTDSPANPKGKNPARFDGDSSEKSDNPLPNKTLQDIIADELARTGLGDIDDNLLKLLLIKNLAGSSKNSSDLTISSVSNQLKWQQLGADIAPKLATDGSNFPQWSASVINTVKRVTAIADYFKSDSSAIDPLTSNGVLALLQHSVDPVLRSSLNGSLAYGAYKSLKDRFASTSWSLLLNRWNDIAQAADVSDSLSASYEAMQQSWLDLEERLGGFTADKLLSLSFHSAARRYQQTVADSMDARLAITPAYKVTSLDILNTATRLHQSALASGSASAMAVSTSSSKPPANRGGRGRGGYRGGCGSSRPTSDTRRSSSSSNYPPPPDNWAKQYLTPKFPCNFCWDWGHWTPDCPRVKSNLPPLEDPRKKNPSWRPKKSNVLSGRLVIKSGELASVSATPESPDDLLCDTGATHHVTSHPSYFINLRPANIRLRVASQDRIPVDGIGDAVIPTRFGDLHLKNVLFVPRVCGTVISVGFFDRWDGKVQFRDGCFFLIQGTRSFPTYLLNYRWFISSSKLSSSPASCLSSPQLSSLSVSDLWHARLGHVAIRFFNRTISNQCVSSIPIKKLPSSKSKCHSCSLAKSTHLPVKSPSRDIVDAPGDMVAVDLVGPFPPALDGSTYGLVIHDVFSRMTSVVGLKTKAEAGKAVPDWIMDFNRLTPF